MEPKYDPVSFITLIAGMIVGSKVSPSFAAYLLIILMATAGGLVALGRQGPDRKPTGFPFLFIVNCIALAGTTIVSQVLASQVDFIEAPHLFAPVALVIGMIGLDYKTVIPEALKLWKQWRSREKP